VQAALIGEESPARNYQGSNKATDVFSQWSIPHLRLVSPWPATTGFYRSIVQLECWVTRPLAAEAWPIRARKLAA